MSMYQKLFPMFIPAYALSGMYITNKLMKNTSKFNKFNKHEINCIGATIGSLFTFTYPLGISWYIYQKYSSEIEPIDTLYNLVENIEITIKK